MMHEVSGNESRGERFPPGAGPEYTVAAETAGLSEVHHRPAGGTCGDSVVAYIPSSFGGCPIERRLGRNVAVPFGFFLQKRHEKSHSLNAKYRINNELHSKLP
jgi:hypothetical protein